MRAATRIISAVVAIALVLAAVITIVEIGRMLAGAGPWVLPADDWLAQGRSSSWGDTDVRLVLVGAALVGAAFLAFALWPRRIHAVATSGAGSGVDIYVERRGLERVVGERVQRVDGIRDAAVDVKKRKVVVKARATATAGDAGGAVRETAHTALASYGLDGEGRVSVHLKRRAA